MERLTYRDTNGELWYSDNGTERDRLHRLAAYEDTGLTPEEVQQMRWIPVEERLPEKENAQVLMTDGEGCYISSRNNMVRFLNCEGIFIPGKAGAGVKVTRWMPLPQPPKEASHD